MKKVYILWCALVSLATMGYAQKQVFGANVTVTQFRSRLLRVI